MTAPMPQFDSRALTTDLVFWQQDPVLELLGHLGLFFSGGVGRFQNVQTAPSARRSFNSQSAGK